MAAPPPPVRLRRNVSKSLDSITDAIRKYEKSKAPVLPPRPQQQQQQVGKQKPLPPPPSEYEIVLPSVAPKPKLVSKPSAKDYDLETFCKEVSLPHAIEITDGFCGPTEDIPIGFQMMIYFQKTARVVQAKDALNYSYNIPLGSSLKFAPIDELKPPNDQTGFFYDTVETMLMERPSLPKVVKVKYAFTRGKHSVMSNDIVFPKKIEKNLLGNKIVGLVCTKMNGDDIKLPLECSCGFSTAAMDNQLYIVEYIEYVNQFPVKVAVFGDISTVAMPSTLTLLKEHTLKSLVARSRHTKNEQIVEIPIDLPIQLKCLEEDISIEHEQVKKAYEAFNPSLVSNYYSLAETNSQHRAQQRLYSQVRSDMVGTKYYNLAAPEKIYESVKKELTNTLPLAHSKSVDDDSHEVSLDKSVAKSSPGPRHKILKAAGNLISQAGKSALKQFHHEDTTPDDMLLNFTNQLESLKQEVTDVKSSLEKLKLDKKEEVKQQILDGQKELNEEVRKIRLSNARCMQQVSKVSQSLEELQRKPAASAPPRSPVYVVPQKDVYQCSPEDNKKFLQSLDHLKVLQVLDGMNLSQYCAAFRDDRVDGQLLATLTQTELNELKVNSALHQRKLLNIIDGKESAEKYLRLSNEDPYYT
ncbi:uncharacterized protein [Dysidea avara]|uniref:uncharacterized protein n=1 Tax=Dysidea avara TaxID=196820 RepID=UPI00332768BC